MRIIWMMSLLTAALLAATGCASGTSAGPMEPAAASVGIRVEPEAAQAALGGTATFRATVTGTAVTEVTWSADCGSITPAGVYTAPQSAGVCRVTATAAGGAVVGHALVNVGGWAASCAAEPEPTVNVVYVCDCQAGADANCVAGSDTSGKGTKTAPYRSWPKARSSFQGLPSGGTVALCKGGRWSVTDTGPGNAWVNASCTAEAPCTLRDYVPTPWASGDEAAPVLATAPASNLNVFRMNDGVAHMRILNLHLLDTAGGTSASSYYGLFAYGNTHDVEVCNNTVDGYGISAYVTVKSAMAECNSYGWKFRGNRFLNSCVDAMLMTTRDLDVDGNYFDNNGTNRCGAYAMESSFDARDGWPWGPTTHSVYFTGGNCPVDNLKFRNNEVHRNAVYQGYVQGSAVKIKSRGDNILVENNLVDMTPPHPSISGTVTAIAADDSGEVGFDRMVVRGNRIPGGKGSRISISSASNLLVEDNILTATGDLENHHSAITLSHKPDERRATTATVRNNTIYYSGSGNGLTSFNLISLAHASSGSGNVVTGNSITIAGGADNGSCFRISDPSKVAFMDNNQCTGAAGFATVDGVKPLPLPTWRATYPHFDANSLTPPLAGLFLNAPVDFTPASASPLIDAASTGTCTIGGVANQPCSSTLAVGDSTWNQLGAVKSRDAAPDIGAMER